MALWQFHCYIIPRENRNLNEKSCDEDILSWKKHIIPTARIDFLEKQTGWTEDIVQYGKDDETCIQFLYEEGLLEEISCRLDLRSLSIKMLEQVMEYINKIEGMILYENKISDCRQSPRRKPRIFLVVRAWLCSPLRSFSLIRKTELWRTNKPPALRVVKIALALCKKPPLI